MASLLGLVVVSYFFVATRRRDVDMNSGCSLCCASRFQFYTFSYVWIAQFQQALVDFLLQYNATNLFE